MPVILTDHDLSELLTAFQVGEWTDTVRLSLAWVLQQRIEARANRRDRRGAGRRSSSRIAQRNGFRAKLLSTAAGDVGVGIPKRRSGSLFPSILEQCRRVDWALFEVVMAAYADGVSTAAAATWQKRWVTWGQPILPTTVLPRSSWSSGLWIL